ncbi:MAG: phosphohistidine phosphatase SixA [Planctomycetes bacterium]|nr:phosphohistidine phosphatase SixA [Planctomycetota bacterium]MBL7041523.1 phosphohistidine phosphatase SixA [Pirellulaceae bacterium]
MTDTQSHRRLYLVRHGEAKPKDEDPERGLKDAGRTDATRMAAWAAAAGIQVGQIQHSGKLRAQQTAEIFAEQLGTPAMAALGLAPNDDVDAIVGVIEHEQCVIMLVGHLPFLERLAALLITGNAEDRVLTLEAGALAELMRTDDGWKVTCLMHPRLLPRA